MAPRKAASPSTAPKPFVFVLMPFAKAFDNIYKFGIAEACRDAGTYGERVDQQIYTESTIQRIYNQIQKADIVVSDMTGQNPNVFYETGYAHALGKCVILLTQKVEDIPFDMRGYPHIIYDKDNIAELKTELKKKVKHFAANPSVPYHEVNNIHLLFDGEPLAPNRFIHVNLELLRNVMHAELRFDINNMTDYALADSAIQLGLIYPTHFQGQVGARPDRSTNVSISLHKKMVVLAIGQILPQGWNNGSFMFGFSDVSQGSYSPIQVVVKLFTEKGIKEIPIQLIFIKK